MSEEVLTTLQEKAQLLTKDAYDAGKQEGTDETVDKWDEDKEAWEEEREEMEEDMSQRERQIFIDGFNNALHLFEELFTGTNGYDVQRKLEEYSRVKLQLWVLGTLHNDRKTSPPPLHTGGNDE